MNPIKKKRESSAEVSLGDFVGFQARNCENRTDSSIEQLSAQNPAKVSKRQSRISFDKYDFYFLIVLLSSLFALIYLISGASISYKEA